MEEGKFVLDKETLTRYLPKGSSVKLTDELLKILNNAEKDTGVDQDLFAERICSYSHLIKGGATMLKLANAIKFVSLRMLPKMGNAKAYRIVFPKKTKEIEERGQSVDSFASMYKDTKLVVEVQKLVMIPVNISHAPVHNAMLKKLFDLTNGIGAREGDYVTPTVQMNSAIELAKLTAQPEDNNIELKIGLTDEAKSIQEQFMAQIASTTQAQMERLRAGQSLEDVQKIGLKDVSVTEEVIDV